MINWRSCIGIFLGALGLASNAAHAGNECEWFAPVVASDRGLDIGSSTIKLRAVAYTTPRIADTGNIDVRLIERDFSAIKKAGFNSIRSYEPLEPTVLDLAESEGLFIIQAVVHLSDETNFDSEEELKEVIEKVQRVVFRDRCRKGVIMWSIWNDAPFNWGTGGGNVVERFGAETVHKFLSRLRDAVKNVDSNRPLTAANVLNAKHFEIGMDLLDVIGMNVYLGIFDWQSQRFSNAIAKNVVFLVESIARKYKKPIWISETGLSSVLGSDPPEAVIPAQIILIEKSGLLGFAIFQWRDDKSKARDINNVDADVEANWGLHDTAKAAKPALAKITLALKGDSESLAKIDLSPSDPWVIIKEDYFANLRTWVVEDFRFDGAEPVRAVYKILSKGKCRVFYGSTGASDRSLQGLSLRYVPEDYGAWLVLGRTLEKTVSPAGAENLIVHIRDYNGGHVNMIISFGLKDGRVVRAPPLLLHAGKKTIYKLEMKNMIYGERGVSMSEEISSIRFRLNDVPNLEEIGVPVQIVVDSINFTTAN